MQKRRGSHQLRDGEVLADRARVLEVPPRQARMQAMRRELRPRVRGTRGEGGREGRREGRQA